jgi:hypothetical protein
MICKSQKCLQIFFTSVEQIPGCNSNNVTKFVAMLPRVGRCALVDGQVAQRVAHAHLVIAIVIKVAETNGVLSNVTMKVKRQSVDEGDGAHVQKVAGRQELITDVPLSLD